MPNLSLAWYHGRNNMTYHRKGPCRTQRSECKYEMLIVDQLLTSAMKKKAEGAKVEVSKTRTTVVPLNVSGTGL